MSRKIKGGWIQGYHTYIHKQESPSEFHFWVGMSMISASLRRHIHIDRGAYKVHPNQYIILLAESATCRKSVAMEIGLHILETNENVKIVHERATLEGLIDVMKRSWIAPGGAVKPDGSIVLHADELSNLFGKASFITDLTSFLTSAYTSKSGTMDFLTRNKGWAKVQDPCPCLLAGTTPEQLGEIFPVMTLASGFMGRVLLIVGRRGERVSKPLLRKEMEQNLADDLFQMGMLEGEMKLTDEAEEIYTKWYESMPDAPSTEAVAFHERKHDHVLKTAMLLSISDSDEMELNREHLEIALNQIEHVELNIPRAVAYVGATDRSNIGDVIVRMITRNAPEALSHSLILNRMYKRLQDSEELTLVMNTLCDSERVKREVRSSGIYYTIKKENANGR